MYALHNIPKTDKERLTRFRIEVKKRIYGKNTEALEDEPAAAIKQKLSETYDNVVSEHAGFLKKVER
jgi:hypothetical protein